MESGAPPPDRWLPPQPPDQAPELAPRERAFLSLIGQTLLEVGAQAGPEVFVGGTAGLVGGQRAVDHVGGEPALGLGGSDAVGVVAQESWIYHECKAIRRGPAYWRACSTAPAT